MGWVSGAEVDVHDKEQDGRIAKPLLPARLTAELHVNRSHVFPAEEAAEACGLRLEILAPFS